VSSRETSPKSEVSRRREKTETFKCNYVKKEETLGEDL